MSKFATGTIPKGVMTSFKLDPETSKAAKKESFMRRIPLSMWLREAAREKLRRERRRKQTA